MRQRKMWLRLVAAVIGAIALADTASAQNQSLPVPMPGAGQAAPVYLPIPQPPGPTIPSVPALASATPIPPGTSATIVPSTVGCSSCGSGKAYKMSGGYLGSNCQNGRSTCNSGCGSFRADNAFMFGSCKSFFSPCGPTLGGHRGGCGGLFGERCPGAQILGHGPSGPFNPCVYDSYLNH